jgi:hypothetical protein
LGLGLLRSVHHAARAGRNSAMPMVGSLLPVGVAIQVHAALWCSQPVIAAHAAVKCGSKVLFEVTYAVC